MFAFSFSGIDLLTSTVNLAWLQFVSRLWDVVASCRFLLFGKFAAECTSGERAL